MATKEGVDKKAPLTISYNDADDELIRVEDDSDLQMAYCIALSSDGKIKFIIDYPQVAPKVNISPLVIPAPVAVEEVKQESKPELPKMVPQVKEHQNCFPIFVTKEETATQPNPVIVPVEETKIEEV